VAAIERRPIGDWIKGERTVWSDTQGVADAENLTVQAAIHLSLHEAMQGEIHRDASSQQRNNDKRERN
jgi:hypothetical protein